MISPKRSNFWKSRVSASATPGPSRGWARGMSTCRCSCPLPSHAQTAFRRANGAQHRRQRHEQVVADGDALDKGVAVSPNGDLFVSLRGVGLLRSADNGRTWTPSQEGITFTNTLFALLTADGLRAVLTRDFQCWSQG